MDLNTLDIHTISENDTSSPGILLLSEFPENSNTTGLLSGLLVFVGGSTAFDTSGSTLAVLETISITVIKKMIDSPVYHAYSYQLAHTFFMP